MSGYYDNSKPITSSKKINLNSNAPRRQESRYASAYKQSGSKPVIRSKSKSKVSVSKVQQRGRKTAQGSASKSPINYRGYATTPKRGNSLARVVPNNTSRNSNGRIPRANYYNKRSGKKTPTVSRSPINIRQSSVGRRTVTPQRPAPKGRVYAPPKGQFGQKRQVSRSPLTAIKSNKNEYRYIAPQKSSKGGIVINRTGSKDKPGVSLIKNKSSAKGTQSSKIMINGGNTPLRGPIGGWQSLSKNKTPLRKVDSAMGGYSKLNLNRFNTHTPQKKTKNASKITPVRTRVTPSNPMKTYSHPKVESRSIVVQSEAKINKNLDRKITIEGKKPSEPIKIATYFSNGPQNNSPIYKKFKEMSKECQPIIRENVKLMAENMVNTTECLVKTNKILQDEKYKKFTEEKGPKIDDFNRKVMQANKEYRVKMVGLLQNLRQNVASDKGAEELFYELDLIASKLKSEPGDSFREEGNKAEFSKDFNDHMNDLSKIIHESKHKDYNEVNDKILKSSQLLNLNASPTQARGMDLGKVEATDRSTYTIKRSPDRNVNYSEIKEEVFDQVKKKIEFNSLNGQSMDDRSVSKEVLLDKIQNEIVKQKMKKALSSNRDKKVGVAVPVSQYSPDSLKRKKEVQVSKLFFLVFFFRRYSYLPS